MKYVIVCIEESDINVTLKEPEPISINYNQVLLTSGGSDGGGSGSSGTSRVYNFVNADLTNGVITFFHDMNKTYVDYSVFNPDVGEVVPDADSYGYNSVTINLSSFSPISGLWTILIEG